MEKIVERIDELLKKKSKIGVGDSSEITKLIYQLYSTNKDCDLLVNYLYNSYYKISGIFVKEYYFKLGEEERKQIIQSLIKNKRFIENFNSTSLFRILIILGEIINKDVTDENILFITKAIIKIAEKNNTFNKISCEHFLIFLNKTNGKLFDIDLATLADHEIRSIFRYVSASIPDISSISYGIKIKECKDKYSYALPALPEIGNSKIVEITSTVDKIVEKPQDIVPTISTEKSSEIENTKELIKTLKSANEEVQKLFDNIFNKNNTIQNLQNKLSEKEKVINSMKIEIENNNSSIVSLKDQINNVKAELEDKEIKITDLTERLKLSFKADEITKNQDLTTLKSDIASAVKLQYEDFNEHQNESCNEDNYEALKVSFKQVFRALNRYGIEL